MSAQSMQSLAIANHVRTTRGDLKRDLRAGRLDVPTILDDIPPELEGMAIYDLLRAQHRWGYQRTRKLLFKLVIAELRPLGALTARQRQSIVDAL